MLLAGIEEHDVREVAKLLGLPEGTVKSRLFTARQRLKELMQYIERRRTDSPPDEALAREIEGLMGVDPSPEFLARVSSCLAEESALLGSRVLGPHKQWSTLLTGSIRLFDCLRHVIRQRVVTPSRQLALTTVILAVLAAPSIYRAVRDRQRYTLSMLRTSCCLTASEQMCRAQFPKFWSRSCSLFRLISRIPVEQATPGDPR